MIAYCIFIMVLSVNFFEDYVTKRPWLMYLSSALATVVWVGVDLTVNMYHYYINDWLLTSIYDSYVLYMIYMFLPMPLLVGPLLLGALVSVLYITYFMNYVAEKFQYELTDLYTYNYMSVDLSHYICFNLLGTFFRLMSDIIVRASFLDRHQYVMENIWLRSARHQEKMLLHSILPPQIARPIQDEMRSRVARVKKGLESQSRLFHSTDRIMAVQIHPEVTILYADVVNYTKLTTTLTVEKLVTLLHDLYGRFDMAASHFRVQRIKFLGDCYYCVAGLTRPNFDHAKCCVDLGLSMIAHIQDVREERQLDIGMRIGVHSGNLFAGVIGEAKLQYDIWGQDVTIANRLESTGLQGHVHISGSTLMNLDANEYVILPGTKQAANDPFLQMHNVSTYLLHGDNSYRASTQTVDVIDSVSVLNLRSKMGSVDNAASKELHEEFLKMPLGARNIGYFLTCRDANGEQSHVPPNLLTVYFLHFQDPSLEWKYMRQTDYMLKYSLLYAWCIGVSLVYIQLVDHSGPNIYCFLSDFMVILIWSSFLFVSWYKKICTWRYGKEAAQHRYGRFSCLMFRIKDKVQRSLSLRISVYLFIIISYYQVLGIIVIDCNREEYTVLHIESKLYQYEMNVNMCFRPWVLTNMVALIMGLSFTFTRIPFLVKTMLAYRIEKEAKGCPFD
ncbi:adenylyl cyclase X E-like isoform X2 [Drosophila tropicalis]|uniref:adenylyl cyclase X E-like isoform X2 n=1 Tax=Drosophila tropicalis TaxID=46794 RepID=UPI0035ABEA6C